MHLDEKILLDLFPAVNAKRGLINKEFNVKGFVDTFNQHAEFFNVSTCIQTKHFVAQVAHESDQWNAYEEYASGSAYENRRDLGNVKKGDGIRFKGRGPFQITGRNNYRKIGQEIFKLPFLTEGQKSLFADNKLLKHPELIATPMFGTLAALIYWKDKDLSSLCHEDGFVTIERMNNSGKWYEYTCEPIEAITRKINGGINGLADRKNALDKLNVICN